MSGAKKMVPKRRFKEFLNAGDWEQRKLIDIAKTFIGLVTTMTENYRDSGTLLIRNSDIKEGQFLFSENPIHLDEEFAEKNKTRRLQIGDVVTVHTGDIGTSAVIEEKEAGAIGFATINTRTDKSILNPYFLATYFNTEKHKCYANSVSTGDGRSNYNIKDFNKLVISVPTLDEQERISVLINDINIIITLHQRKLDKLQATKKALLQEMFPEEGQDKPKRRFKGFTDAWEQRKLGDLAEIVRGASPRPISDPKWFDNDSSVGWLRIADVTAQDGRIRYLEQKISELGQEKTRVIKTPHLLLSIAATVGKPVINYVPTGVHDGFLIFLNPKFNILYTFWWLEMFQEKWNKYGQPGSQVNLNSDLVKNQVINIPNEKEQEKISSFLESLDKIITLHQRKLDKLKNLKRAYLNELFV